MIVSINVTPKSILNPDVLPSPAEFPHNAECLLRGEEDENKAGSECTQVKRYYHMLHFLFQAAASCDQLVCKSS